ncbi:hypothetical protein [Pedosphaera parvula]|uniref:Uncharacterized protein n=1 Tax=Pedosphaera parvula (strain Ellin514) TaxID=320771 RepID=B9XQY5_PEDPL|nr:hypothetical protein [Pedosphaera parvula]EEF57762.1 hypothetical protein Cflav_PD0644 [Pedosphaera parvula Ellin514]
MLNLREGGLLIAQQFFQLVPSGIFTTVRFTSGHEVTATEIKIFAEIAHMLLLNRVGPAVAALMGRARIVADAVQADPQVSATTMARFASPGVSRESPFPSALVTMTCQGHVDTLPD